MSKKSSQSDSSSKPSSGNNSKRNSLSSSSSFSGKEEVINLGTTNDVDVAEENTIKFIKKELGEPEGEWVPHWGSKLTDGVKSGEGLANLGRVIGKDFMDSRPSNNEQKNNNSSYRVDWEKSKVDSNESKGRHYNAVLITRVKNRYIAYPFGDKENDSQIDPITKKAIGEQSMINKMLEMTASALEKNELMKPEIAQRILKNFENPSPHIKEHFKEFGYLLRELINKTHNVILQSGKANNEDAYKFDAYKLNDRVTEYLAEIWKPVVMNQLQAIMAGSTPEEEAKHVEQVILSECIYAASNSSFSDKVFNDFSSCLLPIAGDQHVNLFMDYLKGLPDEREPLLEEFEKRIYELRPSNRQEQQDNKSEKTKKLISSTSNAMLAMMSRSQATQALSQTLQASTISESLKSTTSSSSTVSSSLANVSLDNAADLKEEDTANTNRNTRRFG